jgi:hypothetical protein
MAERNGKDHAPVDTLFGEDSFDAGIVKGVGHVIVREARLADIWPYMGADSNASEFGLRLIAASVEINGKRFTFEQFGQISIKHMAELQKLFRDVQRVNGMLLLEQEEPARPNADGADAGTAPDGSATATGS